MIISNNDNENVKNAFTISTLHFDYHQRSCNAQPQLTQLRNDFTGEVGLSFNIGEVG